MMQADIFYQIKTDVAYQLTLLSIDDLARMDQHEQQYMLSQRFEGRSGEVCVKCFPDGHIQHVYIGIEQQDDVRAIAEAVTMLPKGVYQVTSLLSYEAQLIWSLAQYVFDTYKPSTQDIRVLLIQKAYQADLLAEASAIFLTRDLINMPACDMNPEKLTEIMMSFGKMYGSRVTECVGDVLLTKNFPAIYAVGKAASIAPRLIELTWGNPDDPKITLIGKGVCFDSGGLDLKSSSNMRLMKKDMGGAAIAIGLTKWVMMQKLPIHLTVLIPAVENAVGERAYRPGDILRMRNGLTVEIENTDAEGRLILADALTYAAESHPELIMDFSTLTGAARIAVGTEISAYFTEDDTLSDALMKCSRKTRDYVWRLPLFSPYQDLLRSSIADMQNASSSPYAGAITAALFLKSFVNMNISWIHFDTMAWNVGSKLGKPEGGEAMGLQTVARYLKARFLK